MEEIEIYFENLRNMKCHFWKFPPFLIKRHILSYLDIPETNLKQIKLFDFKTTLDAAMNNIL